MIGGGVRMNSTVISMIDYYSLYDIPSNESNGEKASECNNNIQQKKSSSTMHGACLWISPTPSDTNEITAAVSTHIIILL